MLGLSFHCFCHAIQGVGGKFEVGLNAPRAALVEQHDGVIGLGNYLCRPDSGNEVFMPADPGTKFVVTGIDSEYFSVSAGLTFNLAAENACKYLRTKANSNVGATGVNPFIDSCYFCERWIECVSVGD